tara:strand:+ start:30 stop:545 length:516 start_codon:yes stop_codon:yes gene_type:complete
VVFSSIARTNYSSSPSSVCSVLTSPTLDASTINIDQTLDISSFRQWLREVPALTDLVNIEAVYRSNSTLVLVSGSIGVWELMPDHLATRLVGFISSKNLKNAFGQEDESAETPAPTKTTDASYTTWHAGILHLPAPRLQGREQNYTKLDVRQHFFEGFLLNNGSICVDRRH